ncbi:MAG: type 1 glutamine amidotransferase domain-containing protein, partial [Acidaminococcus sp.]|nr:type 1 glutamine amidotransferase domain-containing protein [Acidaminococcus sp.]
MKLKRVATMLLAACLMVPGLGGVTEAAASKGKILVVASSQNKMELANHTLMDVGFYLNEFAVPTEYLADKGYDIELATPNGKLPDMDKSSNNSHFFGGDDAARAKAVKFVESLKPITLKKALKNRAQYAAVFVPGGHAPMTDLMQDP